MKEFLQQLINEQKETNRLLKITIEQNKVNGLISVMNDKENKEQEQIRSELELIVKAHNPFDEKAGIDSDRVYDEWAMELMSERISENDEKVRVEAREIFGLFYPKYMFHRKSDETDIFKEEDEEEMEMEHLKLIEE
ncbi:hypothetical protein [Aliivibrio finisterrensis]|uniref:Uncharacterized protein n=1 Tax=Aliivibrio finisterrensis TaxID=511998 RepID=A0A6N6RU47_9GAMM|nr:hypothetical protein [Aliivibrio finisterrensis]KAB2825195.1 hypothetical protein F8B77_05980 [Aliivibrio finisterrensis]